MRALLVLLTYAALSVSPGAAAGADDTIRLAGPIFLFEGYPIPTSDSFVEVNRFYAGLARAQSMLPVIGRWFIRGPEDSSTEFSSLVKAVEIKFNKTPLLNLDSAVVQEIHRLKTTRKVADLFAEVDKLTESLHAVEDAAKIKDVLSLARETISSLPDSSERRELEYSHYNRRFLLALILGLREMPLDGFE